MAGIQVIACLPAEASADLRTSIAEAMAPFRLMEVPEWRGIWDSWNISGGSDGHGFRTLPGHEDDARLIHDDHAVTGEPFPSWPGWCAGGPRMLLDVSDFRGMPRMPRPRTRDRPLFWPDVLTLDGWWIEDGLHPRHGVCDSDESCPHMAQGWSYQADLGGYLESLGDEALLVRLRCHG